MAFAYTWSIGHTSEKSDACPSTTTTPNAPLVATSF